MTTLIMFFVSLAVSMGTTQAHDEEITQFGEDIDGKSAGELSGSSVSLSTDGNVVAVGAPENDTAGSNAGQARVYDYINDAWVQRGADIDGEAAGDHSGDAVSISGDGMRVAIGSPENGDSASDAGQVRVYQWLNDAWGQMGSDLNGEAADDFYGDTVSLSSDGTTLAVGAWGHDSGGKINAGQTRVYRWSGADWAMLGEPIDGCCNLELSAWSVSLSADGTSLAVGVPHNSAAGLNAGKVRVYQWSGAEWNQRGSDITGPAGGHVGDKVAISADGNTVAMGAPDHADNGANAGHVRVFGWSGNDWAQVGVDILGESADNLFGSALAISGDGTRLVVGANRNGGNGTDSGHARVFQLSGSTWTQVGDDFNGEAAFDGSGFSVALSQDSRRMAIGAPFNDDNGADSGHVRVFNSGPPVLSNDFGMNGLMVDFTNDGNGFDFNVHQFGFTIFYYGHTSTGERLWLISELLTADLEFEVDYQLDMFEVINGTFGNPGQGETLWGTLDLHISTCDEGTAVLTGNDGTASFDWNRLAGQQGAGCQ